MAELLPGAYDKAPSAPEYGGRGEREEQPALERELGREHAHAHRERGKDQRRCGIAPERPPLPLANPLGQPLGALIRVVCGFHAPVLAGLAAHF